jgi:glycosyltransferase involved in cell wall biosynthesis
MAVHNGMPYLETSVRSILAQTFGDFEFVIGDDGSSDGSTELLRRFASADGRIRLLRRESKSGLAASANWVAGEARAPLIAIAHADDYSYPRRLEREVALLRAYPDAVLVGTLSDGIDEAGRRVRPVDAWRLTHASPFAPFAHSSIMFRREAFAAVGGYRAEAEYWEDLDLYFRLSGRGRLLVVPETLSSVRHARTSTRLRDEGERVENAVDTMYRAAAAFWAGEDYEAVLSRPRTPGEKLHPRTFVARGSTRLWSGRSPQVLRQMLRRGGLGANPQSLQALLWGAWGELSPRTLRLLIRSLLRLGNLAARPRLAGRDSVEWRPRPRRTGGRG